MSIELSAKEKKLYEMLSAIPPKLEEAEEYLNSEKFSSTELSAVANFYVDECMFDVDDYVYENDIPFPKTVVPNLRSTYVCDIISLLLRRGMEPNDIVEGKYGTNNIMHNLKYIANEYLAADALAMLLECGGNMDMYVEGETLFHMVDFDLFFDVIEQENRQRLSSIAHFWMVIVGYRGKYIDDYEKMQLFREYNTEEIFDLNKLRNHRNYEFVICHHENDFAIHIYDKETLWEVASFR